MRVPLLHLHTHTCAHAGVYQKIYINKTCPPWVQDVIDEAPLCLTAFIPRDAIIRARPTPEQNSSDGGDFVQLSAGGTVPARSQDAGELKELVDSLDRVHLFRAKLGFVGRGRSGKTSTFNALKRNVRFDEHERSTIAAECNTLENALHREDVQEWIP